MDYAKSAASATRILTKYGQAVTLRTAAPYVHGAGAVSYNNTTRRGCLFEFSSYRGGDVLHAETLIQSGYKQLYMDANGAGPTLSDRVIVNGVEFMIFSIKPLAPAGTTVLYELVIKT